MRPKRLMIGFGFILTSLACSMFSRRPPPQGGLSRKPPDSFQEADLIGTWNDWNNLYDHETLHIRDDFTFTQIYDDPGSGYHHYEGEGSWAIEYHDSGCVYIHLEGMRYFYATRSGAENGNRYPNGDPISFWDPCEERLTTMPNKVILLIGGDADSPRGLRLLHMKNEVDSIDIVLRLDEDTLR